MARRNRPTTNLKRSFAKSTGIPTTRSGRQAKMRRMATGGGCLIRILSVLTIVAALVAFGVGALAEVTSSPVYDYVSALGFAPMDVGAASEDGLRKCYMQETMESQSISFMENGRHWAVVDVNGLGSWNPDDMRELFNSLIFEFDWDVSFYDTVTSEKFECSYGIKEDIDKTDANYDDIDAYREAVASAMLAADISDAVFTIDYTIYDYCVDLMGEPSSVSESTIVTENSDEAARIGVYSDPYALMITMYWDGQSIAWFDATFDAFYQIVRDYPEANFDIRVQDFTRDEAALDFMARISE